MRRQTCARFLSSATVTIALAGCTGSGLLDQASAPPVAPAAPAIAPEAVVGSWGLGSYHREEDRARTETAARNQCGKPYEIARGTNGGVIMHLADQPQAQELVLKGAAGGRTFIGPPGEAGGPQDREILSYDGKIMIMRWVDAGVGARYGTLVFARCGPARTAATPR
jgi:hypothetical protein